ncbi:beta-N-acetylhexosaminidase [Sphingobacterium hungaricum]|uniref:Beta-N-acetylhexosaminidase n=1 Tax=Sphingobacterium hungaricum TaxID=2082723 RepID=A0A928YQR1_9SPHI|nr:beta-N-acetylhexosaminidase [Sphingobacterium hungaricum]MBE8714224.1 beta-N-acetylhexosaminidase [Sphingobacterium hungaricum]
MRQPVFSQTKPLHDFAVKGFHLDLRIQVMPMPALKAFAKKLSENGINTLVMEWEASYPFEKHPLIANRFAYSREEVKKFIAYCAELGIDVIPLQQSFGHVEYILRNYEYKELREDQKDYSQINPLKEDLAKALFTDLYRDLISTHTSEYIHIGGDETYLLGHSEASKKKVAEVGKGRLYGDYIKLLCDLVVSLGKRPVLWADIALKYPDALEGLPKETVFVDWNYGWDINMFGDHSNLMKSGFEVWGAPSIRSHPDNYFLTQWEKHFTNIHDFIPIARDFGYKGMIMTSWSTSGLYAPLWESTRDIVDLYTIRRVYPISGFSMLIDAFFTGVNTAEPLDINGFIIRYAKKQYGFTDQQATDFWNALRAAPYEVTQGKVVSPSEISIEAVLDTARSSSATLKKLTPKSNAAEFEHYRLMADIRVQYLTYYAIEIEANSPQFRSSSIPDLLKRLEALDTKGLDKRFEKLNKHVLYPAEIAQEKELRNSKIRLLHQRLSNNKVN